MRPPVILAPEIFNERLGRLTVVGGDLERSGLTLEDVSDMIYTRRMNINPLGEPEEKKEKAPKAKPVKTTGLKMDDLLG